MRAVYGLYPDPAAAERAMKRLRASGSTLGFDARHICLAASEPLDEFDLGWKDQKTPMPWLAALGGLIGGTSGYFLVSLTQRAYPLPTGNMPIVALWPTGVVVYEMTMLGAILTTFISLLVSARLPHWSKGVYDPAVSEGKILVGVVNPSQATHDELVKTLREAGAEEVKDFPSS